REEGKMKLRRGFTVDPGARALVVEDVVTTGGSAQEVVALLKELGLEVVGVSAIVWRSPEAAPASPFGDLRFRPLLTLPTGGGARADCPQGRGGKPFEKPGSRIRPGSVAQAGK